MWSNTLIIKSHVRGGFGAAAAYLKDAGQNESVRIVEISDPDATGLDEAFRNMWDITKRTRASKALHLSASIRRRTSGSRTHRCYASALGWKKRTATNPATISASSSEHIKDGRQHFHVMWNRVSLTTGRPVWPGHHWNKSRQAAREMEAELDLKRPVPRRAKPRKLLASVRMQRFVGAGRRYLLKQSFKAAGRAMTLQTQRPLRIALPKPAFAPRRPAWLPTQRRDDKGKAMPLTDAPAYDPGLSRDELIAFAWETGRLDILAQLGIPAEFGP